MKSITDFISHYPNFFPSEFCDSVVQQFENKMWTTHTWQTNSQQALQYDTQELSVYLLSDDDMSISKVFWENIRNCINNYQAENNTITYTANVSKIRLNRYNKNTKMRLHVDHIYDLFDGLQKGIPVLSIIINLNDTYEGGELRFFDTYDLKLGKGDVVIFPSNFMYPHSVNEITKNTRYSAVAWAY
jgi:predicted 2-oxoglutarate/Fe(II)-dependent dioxygenase YbiX